MPTKPKSTVTKKHRPMRIPTEDAGAAELANELIAAGGSVAEAAASELAAGELVVVSASLIDPNPYQPRMHFDDAGLKTLAVSIQDELIHRPIVRRAGDRYQIVVGERRMRAMRDVLGWADIPVDVRAVPDTKMFALAWRENRERYQLSGIEEARAAAALRDRLLAERMPVTNEIIATELDYRSPESARQLLLIADRIDHDTIREIEAELTAAGETSTNDEGLVRPKTIHDLPKARLLEIAQRDVAKAVSDSVRRALKTRAGRPTRETAATARAQRSATRRVQAAERFVRGMIASGAPSRVAIERLPAGGIAMAVDMDPAKLPPEDAEALLLALEPVRKGALKARRRGANCSALAERHPPTPGAPSSVCIKYDTLRKEDGR